MAADHPTTTSQQDPPASGGEPRKMLTEAEVLSLVPVGRTTLYRMCKAGRFPKGTYVSPNRRLWFQDQVVAWQNAVNEFDPARGRGKGRRRRATAPGLA